MRLASEWLDGAARLCVKRRQAAGPLPWPSDKLYASYTGRSTSQVLLAPGRTFEVMAKFDF